MSNVEGSPKLEGAGGDGCAVFMTVDIMAGLSFWLGHSVGIRH
jgi:hypothetical protein